MHVRRRLFTIMCGITGIWGKVDEGAAINAMA
jgi:hypothetical protein